MSEPKTIYYKNEDDDFISSNSENKKIDGDYKFLHTNSLWNLLSFFIYRIIMTPFIFLYMKMKFNIRVEGKEKLNESKGKGFFLYINHTQTIGDAFLPTYLCFPKKAYVIVNPYNVNMPIWGNFIKFLGPLPLPDTIHAWKNYINAISDVISKKCAVAIYPEAHVWDYYTKIRNFDDRSFKYPIKNGALCYSATVTYQRNKNKSKPKIVVYIDGPFLHDENGTVDEKQKKLRDTVYEAMIARSKNSNVEYIRYEKIKEEVHD